MRVFYWILLIIWFFVGYFLCSKYLCKDSNPKEKTEKAAAPVLPGCDTNLTFRDRTLGEKSPSNFTFMLNDFNFETPSAALSATSIKVAEYLKKFPKRYMEIKAYYHEKEKNGSSLENLGLARAARVKNYFESKGVSADQLRITSAVLTTESCFSKNKILQKGIAVDFGEIQ